MSDSREALQQLIQEMREFVTNKAGGVSPRWYGPTLEQIETWAGRLADVLRSPVPAKMFPILDGPPIPWSVIAPFEKQAQRNHGRQTLERLAQRGGLGVCEVLPILHAKDYMDYWRARMDGDQPSRDNPPKETLILELVALIKERASAEVVSPQEERLLVTQKFLDAMNATCREFAEVDEALGTPMDGTDEEAQAYRLATIAKLKSAEVVSQPPQEDKC